LMAHNGAKCDYPILVKSLINWKDLYKPDQDLATKTKIIAGWFKHKVTKTNLIFTDTLNLFADKLDNITKMFKV
jgi:hypothetical protein